MDLMLGYIVVKYLLPCINAFLSPANRDGNLCYVLNFQKVTQSNTGNIFFSPFSVMAALGMTYGGACGNTREEMRSAMHLTQKDDDIHDAFFDIISDIKVCYSNDIATHDIGNNKSNNTKEYGYYRILLLIILLLPLLIYLVIIN